MTKSRHFYRKRTSHFTLATGNTRRLSNITSFLVAFACIEH